MTIGSSNVSFGTIASEKGIATSNLSLKDLSDKEVKTNIASGTTASSTFALVKTTAYWGGNNGSRNAGTVTSAQGTGSAGLNTTPYSMSEWVGYDPVANTKLGLDSIDSDRTFFSGSCIVPIFQGIEIYCQKSGGKIYIYGKTASGFGTNQPTFYNHTSSTQTGATQTIAMIEANTSGMIPTGCTMSYTTINNSSSGTMLGTGGTVATTTGGATSTTNLGSTKIGYKITQNTQSEGAEHQTGSGTFRVGVRFNWTFPSGPSGTTYNNTFHEVRGALTSYVEHTGEIDAC